MISNKVEVRAQNVNDENIEYRYIAKYVVCTVPLGILKIGNIIQFNPPLPQSHQHAINRMGWGLMDKIVFNFFCSFFICNFCYFCFFCVLCFSFLLIVLLCK